jgi:hypothetical protein
VVTDEPMTNHRVDRDGSWWTCRFCRRTWPFPGPLPSETGPCVPRDWNRETPAEKAGRLARTYSPYVAGPVGMAACGCPNNIFGTPPALHICQSCGFEGSWTSVHEGCRGCAYLAELGL